MTPEPFSPTGTDETMAGPPPGCPAHGIGPGGLRRLYGPEAEDLGAVYEKLRAEHGTVAPTLLHEDVPIWVVLGHSENLQMVSSPSLFSRDTRLWTALQDGTFKPDHPLMPHVAWQPVCCHACVPRPALARGPSAGTDWLRGILPTRRHRERRSGRGPQRLRLG